MILRYDLLLLPHIAAAVLLAALLALVVVSRREALSPWLAGVVGALLLWTVAYIFELATPLLADKLVWADVQFIGATLLPVLWYLAMRVAAGAAPLSRRVQAALWCLAAAIVAVVYVNPGHLFRAHPALDLGGPIAFVSPDYGPLYYFLGLPFAYGLLTITVVSLAKTSSRGPSIVRARSRLLLAATLIPMISGALYVAGLLPWHNFNPTTASLAVAAVLCGVALVRYRLLDLAPLARETVVEQLCDGVLVCDARGVLVDFNPAAGAILPALRSGGVGRRLEDLFAGRPELLAALAAARAEAMHGEPLPAPHAHSSAAPEEDGTLALVLPASAHEIRYFSVRVTPVTRRTGQPLGEAILLHDITRRVELLRDVRRLATTDELTELLSRRQLLALGEQEVSRSRRKGRPLAVLLLDLDSFKSINDVHGHAAGDEVLRALAAGCRAELRDFDLIGRYGGDEICVVLPEVGQGQALAVAERLRAAAAGLNVWYDGSLIGATVSIGVAATEGEDATPLSVLIEEADEALYRAKGGGRDRVVALLG